MNEVQINKIKKRADEYATSCFPYEKQFLEREAVVKCCVHVVTETIAELEKENAELKEQCSILADCNTCTSTCKTENIEMKKQLTKAKDILKGIVDTPMYNQMGGEMYENEEYKELIVEAEQFLKENSTYERIQKTKYNYTD